MNRSEMPEIFYLVIQERDLCVDVSELSEPYLLWRARQW